MLFRGGLYPGFLTEICGDKGTGKTQLSLLFMFMVELIH